MNKTRPLTALALATAALLTPGAALANEYAITATCTTGHAGADYYPTGTTMTTYVDGTLRDTFRFVDDPGADGPLEHHTVNVTWSPTTSHVIRLTIVPVGGQNAVDTSRTSTPCQEATTSTAPAPTTTRSATSTTPAPPVSTTATSPPTASSLPPANPTTVAPATTATPSPGAPAPPSSSLGTSPSTSSPTSTEPHVAVCCPPTAGAAVAVAAPAQTLPATGTASWLILGFAAAVIVLGLLVRRITRRTA